MGLQPGKRWSQWSAHRIIGPNCPGIITLTWRWRASPGEHHRNRSDRPGVEVGHADLPNDVRAQGFRVLDRHRNRWRPGHRNPHIDAIEAFEKDPDTKLIVMIGEIGGDAEERAADYIKANVSKPVVGYVAGFTAP